MAVEASKGPLSDELSDLYESDSPRLRAVFLFERALARSSACAPRSKFQNVSHMYPAYVISSILMYRDVS